MKLVKIQTCYPVYLRKFFERNPKAATQNYRKQLESFHFDGFGLADYWSHALQSLGYEAVELVPNCEPLQLRWAEENGVAWPGGSDWILRITWEQVLREKPDVLFVADYVTFTYEWLRELRAACPSLRLILGWCGAPFRDPAPFKAYDYVLTCVPELVKRFTQMGHRCVHVNHAFDPRILTRIDTIASPREDVTFVGQLVRGDEFHLERERMLEAVMDRVPLSIYSPSYEFTTVDELKALIKATAYTSFKSLQRLGMPKHLLTAIPKIGKWADLPSRPLAPVSAKLKPVLKPSMFGLEMFQLLHDSRVTLNSHIELSSHSASNLRLYEATGVGACLLTDWKENLHELFEPDTEVVAYRSSEECVEKARWLLDHPDKAREIAQRGQERTLRDHTYAQRARQLDQVVKAALKT